MLNSQGMVSSHVKIAENAGGFTGLLLTDSTFGAPVMLGDLDGDGIDDMLVGAPGSNSDAGVVYVLSHTEDWTVLSHTQIEITGTTYFGRYLAYLGDMDADGHVEVAVAAREEVYILTLHTTVMPCVPTQIPFSDVAVPGSLTGVLGDRVTVSCIEGYSGGGREPHHTCSNNLNLTRSRSVTPSTCSHLL